MEQIGLYEEGGRAYCLPSLLSFADWHSVGNTDVSPKEPTPTIRVQMATVGVMRRTAVLRGVTHIIGNRFGGIKCGC